MPDAEPRTSTFALSKATTEFILTLADNGSRRALADDPNLRSRLNVHNGQLTCRAVADALNLRYTSAERALKMCEGVATRAPPRLDFAERSGHKAEN
jgi:alanine dehydrogenase